MSAAVIFQYAEDSKPAAVVLGVDFIVNLVLWPTLQYNYGPKNLYECPAEPRIPWYLFITGLLESALVISLLVPFIIKSCTLEGTTQVIYNVINGILVGAIVLAHIIGAVFVFPIYNVVQYDKSYINYCLQEVYQFSFVSIIITFILIWLTGFFFFVKKCWKGQQSSYTSIGEA